MLKCFVFLPNLALDAYEGHVMVEYKRAAVLLVYTKAQDTGSTSDPRSISEHKEGT